MAGKGLAEMTGGQLGHTSLRSEITTESLGFNFPSLSMLNLPDVMKNFTDITVRLNADGLGHGVGGQGLGITPRALCHTMGQFIGATATGERAELNLF